MCVMPPIWPICCRMGRLPEAWIAPHPRPANCGRWCATAPSWWGSDPDSRPRPTPCSPKAGVLIAVSDLFGVTGRQRLAEVPLGPAYAQRIRSLLELIDILDSHQARFAAMIAERLGAHRGYQAIQEVPGIGPTLAAVFVAEIGTAQRFTDPAHLCSWAGTDPAPPRVRHRRASRTYHQTRLQSGPLGSDRGGTAPPDNGQDLRPQTTHRGSPRPQHRQGCRGTQTAHAGLLRAARRPHPRARPCLGRPEHSRTQPRAAAFCHNPRTIGVVVHMIEPACCHRTAPCPQQLGEGMTGSRNNPALPQRICTITAIGEGPQPHNRTPSFRHPSTACTRPAQRQGRSSSLRCGRCVLTAVLA